MNTKTTIAAIAFGLCLAGCAAAPTPTPSASIDPGRISPVGMPTPPDVAGAKGDIKDLTTGECPTAAGEQTVSGELKSTLTDTADFLVTISWTNATGDVMGRGYKVIQDLAPGQAKKFDITAKVADGATQCVKGVQYGTIKE